MYKSEQTEARVNADTVSGEQFTNNLSIILYGKLMKDVRKRRTKIVTDYE